MVRRSFVWMLGAALGGCSEPAAFLCIDPSDCEVGGRDGVCEPTGFCSFPDGDCPSGRRYGAHAGRFADDCVGEETSGAGDSGGLEGPMGTDGGEGTGMPLESGGAEAEDDGAPDPATSDDPSVGDEMGGTGGEPPDPTDTDGAAATFFDDFERPDSEELGEGWLERNPAVFSLVGGHVEAAVSGGLFHENMFHRLPHEGWLNGEASVELHDLAPVVQGHPQLHLRLQLDGEPMTGYIVWYMHGDIPRIAISRSIANQLTTIEAPVLEPMGGPLPHRLRASIQGTDPVHVFAVLERRGGEDWEEIGHVEMVDGEEGRIRNPGPVGCSGDGSVTDYAFDNFAFTNYDAP